MSLEERLLGLIGERRRERRPRMAQAQLEEVDLHALSVDRGPRFAPVDLRLCAGLVMPGHERLANVTELASP